MPVAAWVRPIVAVLLLGLDAEPRWHQARPAGSGCLPPRCAPGQLPLALPLVAHEGRLFMIGDGADPTRIYESADGITWYSSDHDAQWGVLYGAAHASYRGALWRVGGFVQSADRRTLTSDVWRSPDGRRWQRVSTTAPWSPRARAHLVPFRDTLWLIGGEPNDRALWFTTDGVVWGSRDATGLPDGNPQAVLVHGAALWILGHGAWETATNDVWSSSDGRTWTRVAAAAGWPARTFAGFAVLHDRLWVLGGAGRRDVWSSADGIHWRQASAPLPGPPRAADYSVVFQDALWVFGGKTGGLGGTGFWDGVWYLR